MSNNNGYQQVKGILYHTMNGAIWKLQLVGVWDVDRSQSGINSRKQCFHEAIRELELWDINKICDRPNLTIK